MSKIEELDSIQEILAKFYTKSNTKKKALNYIDKINNIILSSKDKRYLIKKTVENINLHRNSIFSNKLMTNSDDKYLYFKEKDSYFIFIGYMLGFLGGNPTINNYKKTIAIVHKVLSDYKEPVENSFELVKEKQVIDILKLPLAKSTINVIYKKNPLVILNFNMSSTINSKYFILLNTIVNSRNNNYAISTVSEVFMHEVGHALHCAITDAVSIIPNGFNEMFEQTFNIAWNNVLNINKPEVFADCFSIALIYNTKYEDTSSFYKTTSKDNRKTMYDYFDNLTRSSL